MVSEKSICVFLANGIQEQLIGTLYYDLIRGNEIYSFEFNDAFLESTTIQFDPDLYLFKGRQYVPSGKKIFGMFGDCCPDRWGRTLIERREVILSKKEERPLKKLFEIGYLLGVQDATRSGAFRFKYNENDARYIGAETYLAVPPIASLRKLQQATYHFECEEDIYETKWLNQILNPGSSLGGARPKATVQDENGFLWVAKFPSKNDSINNCAWEKTVNDLALFSGLDVAESRFESFGKKSCFLSKRFDRASDDGQNIRIHFSSAMTQLGRTDSFESRASYLDIANFIRTSGCDVENDLKELWKRIVFNIAISNTDDHLRNHGFLLQKNGWKLSPLYDITPNPYPNTLSLNIDERSNEKSIELAMSTAQYYGLSDSEAQENSLRILETVKENWQKIATQYGILKSEQMMMKTAFGG